MQGPSIAPSPLQTRQSEPPPPIAAAAVAARTRHAEHMSEASWEAPLQHLVDEGVIISWTLLSHSSAACLASSGGECPTSTAHQVHGLFTQGACVECVSDREFC